MHVHSHATGTCIFMCKQVSTVPIYIRMYGGHTTYIRYRLPYVQRSCNRPQAFRLNCACVHVYMVIIPVFTHEKY